MKILLTLFLLAALLAMMVQGREQCRGRPRQQVCQRPRHNGNPGRGCFPSNMWYYDRAARACRSMRYAGCGGNENRWCSRTHCERSCRRFMV